MLVILGNGFDIQCGLKTDYLSFFKQRYNEKIFMDLKKCIGQIEYNRFNANKAEHNLNSEIITSYDFYNRYSTDIFKRVSLWDFVFIFEDILSGNPGWYNIENLIFDFVSNNKITYASIISVEERVYKKSLSKHDKLDIILYLIFNKMKISFTPMKFNEWLLLQLYIIEDAFKEYVCKEVVKKEKTYYYRTRKLYEFFIEVKDFDNKTLSLMNFNYTIPSGFKGYIKDMTNIHGNIKKGEIIFGIDEKNTEKDNWIDPKDTKYLFTKTARKIHSIDNDGTFIINRNKDNNILIYGHSLNVQDYSYFQSVFDIYNISESNTIIYIAWTNYDKKRKIRTNTINSAIKLLKHYGNSLKNDKGKNLLHRMLLEKRIRIIEIPSLNI